MAKELKSALRPGLTYRDYWPDAARSVFTPREARKEYNRLRKIANRRLAALQRWYPESRVAMQFRAFPSVKAGESDRRIYNRLYEVSKYLGLKLGSVTGMRSYRKKAIASLQEAGYDFVNEKNFDRFTQFMDEVRTHGEQRDIAYQSEQIVELFGRAEEEKADTLTVARNFQTYLDNEDRPLPKRKDTEGMTAEAIRKRQQPRTVEQPKKRKELPQPLGSTKGSRRSKNRENSKKRRR